MYKKISEEIIQQNDWWTYKHDKYELEDGSEGEYFYGETAGNAMIIPVLNDGRLVLTTQYRYLGSKLSVEFPCGSLRSGERPADAATRELLEETGYKTDNLIKIGDFEPLNGLFKDASHLFVAPELKQVAEPSLDRTENIELIYRRPDEFDRMVQAGEIWDGQTLAAWALAKDWLYRTLNLPK